MFKKLKKFWNFIKWVEKEKIELMIKAGRPSSV